MLPPAAHGLSGWRHRSPRKRAKSPSVVIHSHPCSIARAVRSASGTRLPFAPASASVDEHVDIGQDHGTPSIRSSNAPESSRSTPGWRPRPPSVGSRARWRRPRRSARRASHSRSGSAIRLVRVVPARALRVSLPGAERPRRRIVVRTQGRIRNGIAVGDGEMFRSAASRSRAPARRPLSKRTFDPAGRIQ